MTVCKVSIDFRHLAQGRNISCVEISVVAEVSQLVDDLLAENLIWIAAKLHLNYI